MPSERRLSTGVDGLDELLGGGLLAGTLTVIVGASGIGKTQLGVQFAAAGARQEGRRGIFFDMTARVDSQSHAEYAQRLARWRLEQAKPDELQDLAHLFHVACQPGEILHVFQGAGRRVTQRDMDFDRWHEWQAILAAKLATTIAFFYSHFIRGVRRVVIDGIEPADRPGESIQFELIEYVYHQILRKDADWVARDLLRESFRAHAAEVSAAMYQANEIAAVLLATSHESMLDPLIERPLADGDLAATANTLIYLGKTRTEGRVGRALYIAKHRGSACSDVITPYSIESTGMKILRT